MASMWQLELFGCGNRMDLFCEFFWCCTQPCALARLAGHVNSDVGFGIGRGTVSWRVFNTMLAVGLVYFGMTIMSMAGDILVRIVPSTETFLMVGSMSFFFRIVQIVFAVLMAKFIMRIRAHVARTLNKSPGQSLDCEHGVQAYFCGPCLLTQAAHEAGFQSAPCVIQSQPHPSFSGAGGAQVGMATGAVVMTAPPIMQSNAPVMVQMNRPSVTIGESNKVAPAPVVGAPIMAAPIMGQPAAPIMGRPAAPIPPRSPPTPHPSPLCSPSTRCPSRLS